MQLDFANEEDGDDVSSIKEDDKTVLVSEEFPP
jgi:hypothetical protein